MAQAMKEGWTKNSKYKSIPEQMLRWRSSAWLINLYRPEVLLGLQVHDDSRGGAKLDTAKERPQILIATMCLAGCVIETIARPAAQPVVITQGEPEKPALTQKAGEVCPAPALANESEEDNDND